MLKKNETEETVGFFGSFLLLVKFQLGGGGFPGPPPLATPMPQLRKTKKCSQIFRMVSGVFLQNFIGSKNSAVLEPRTGQFSRT